MLTTRLGISLQSLSRAIFNPKVVPSRSFISATTGESFNYQRESSPFIKTPSEVCTLPYFVRRTKFLSLPVYTERIQGDPQQLVADLQTSFPEWKIGFNKINQHVIVKGLKHHEVRDWLTEKGF
ncbi:54S ribosomal protein img2, mitochondrial [Entomophthora muscae]|uniref:54S ribosomal protein img2, mitochondrial n=1 Tax=Entomophthora muscae TaxID=34485 RepID=A0ACC2SAY5_9FUNG|nr:54S ribosomal protein img2, mitochondrial [Entomophthora muscae]